MRVDLRARFRQELASGWYRLRRALSGAPAPEEVTQHECAQHGAVTQVRPPEPFRRQLAERLDMAARTRSIGVTVQRAPAPSRWLILTSAVAIALSLTGVALLMRRVARQ